METTIGIFFEGKVDFEHSSRSGTIRRSVKALLLSLVVASGTSSTKEVI